MQSECSVPPYVVESPSDLIAAVWRAVREEDRAAEMRRLYRLEKCVRKVGWVRPERWGLPPQDEDDFVQQFLLKVAMLPRTKKELPERPGGYGKQMAKHLMMDARDHLERRKFSEPEDLVELNLDQSGIFSIRNLQEAERLEGELKQLEARIDAYVHEYLKRAIRLRGGAARQVTAWYHLRLRNEPASVAAVEAGLEPGEVSLVQQWAKRGAERVRRLALADEDQERAEVMKRAAG